MSTVKIQGFAGFSVSSFGIGNIIQGAPNWKDTIPVNGSDTPAVVPADVSIVRIHVKEAPVLMEINGPTNADSVEYPATAETPWIECHGVKPGDTLNFKNA